MIAISIAVSSSMLLDQRRDLSQAGDLATRASGARRRPAGSGAARVGRTRMGWRTPCSRDRRGQLRRASSSSKVSAAARGSARCGRAECCGCRAACSALGREQAEIAGESSRSSDSRRGGLRAEIWSSQGRSPPVPARGSARCFRCPAYVVTGRPARGASPSFTVCSNDALKTWWSPMIAQLLEHVARQEGPAVVERRQQARGSGGRGLRPRRGSALMTLTRCGEALHRVVLRLDRDDHAVGGDQRVDGEQAQGRRAVDERR